MTKRDSHDAVAFFVVFFTLPRERPISRLVFSFEARAATFGWRRPLFPIPRDDDDDDGALIVTDVTRA